MDILLPVLEMDEEKMLTVMLLDNANPVMLSPAVLVDAVMRVVTTDEDDNALMLETAGADAVVLAAPALLLETARAANVGMLDGKDVDVPEATAPLDDVAAAVLEMNTLEDVDDVNATTVMFLLVVVNDADLLLLKTTGIGVTVLDFTSVEVLVTPAVLDDANPVMLSPAVLADAVMRVVTADEDDNALVLETAGADAVVLAAPALLLETARAADVGMLDGKDVDVPEATAPLDDVAAAMLEMNTLEDANMLMPEEPGAVAVVLITSVEPNDVTTTMLVPIVADVNSLLRLEVPVVTGVDVVATPVALDASTTVVLFLIIVNDADLLLLKTAGTGGKVLEFTSIEVLAYTYL